MEAAPVKASFVLSKLQYGFSKEAERGIWCFQWNYQHYVDYPQLFGAIKRYRTVGWAREAVGGDRIFQTYDLVSDHMDREPVALTSKNGMFLAYGENGWGGSGRLDGAWSLSANGTGVMIGDLEVRLDGAWKRVSESYARDMTSADGPRWTRGEYTFDAFFGDVVVIMSGQEILRQRVQGVTAEDLNSKCQLFQEHKLFVYLDGVRDKPGMAWFLDLALGQPPPIQSPGGLFLGRKNTLPRVDDLQIYRPGENDQIADDLRVGKPYLLRLRASDPDLNYGDAITSYEWDIGDGRIVATKKPELPFTMKRPGTFHFRARALDKSKKPGEWFVNMAYGVHLQ